MKIFLFIVVITAISISSCSSDNNNSNSNYRINPPEWIQGEWLLEGSMYGESGFQFTNDDLIIILPSLETSQKALFNQSVELGQDVTVDEIKTESSYNLKASFASGQTVTLGFKKISDTKISYDAVQNSVYVRQ